MALAATVNVAVGPGFTFNPSSVNIAPGDTVRWNFAGTHTTTSDRQTGPEVWDSGVQSTGSFSHTFGTAGERRANAPEQPVTPCHAGGG